MRTHPPRRPPADAHAVADIVPNTARSLVGLLEDRGIAAERLCRGLGFTVEDLMNQALLLSHQQMRTLILRAQRLLHDPAIGLASGARQTPVSWGLPGLAMLTCETFGEAIDYGLAHQSQAGAMLMHGFEADEREVRIELTPRLFDTAIEGFLVEESFAGAWAVARSLLGPAFRLLQVEFVHARPAHDEACRRLFRCPVHYGADSHRLRFEAQWLGARLPGYDRVTCSLVRRQLAPLLQRPLGQHHLVESLESRLRHGAGQAPRQTTMARAVNISDRTLRRRLKAQDTSFRTLRDNTRHERARDLLAHTTMSVAEVAEAVGYADARSFRRAFKRWSGRLPADFRRAPDAEP